MAGHRSAAPLLREAGASRPRRHQRAAGGDRAPAPPLSERAARDRLSPRPGARADAGRAPRRGGRGPVAQPPRDAARPRRGEADRMIRWRAPGPYVVAFTTRAGGVSEGPYASLNLGARDDD